MIYITTTDAHHFRMGFHENLTEREGDASLLALEKVERAYLT